jgi:hypothetical protein
MRIQLSTLVAAAAFALAQASIAADEPYTAQPQFEKAGRSADEETVKSGGAAARPGRTVEEDPQSAMSDRDRPGHAIDADGTVKSGGDPARPGRQAEDK